MLVLIFLGFHNSFTLKREKMLILKMLIFQVTPTSTGDGRRKKISAAWVADEDISRLLMSLPNWQLAATSMSYSNPNFSF